MDEDSTDTPDQAPAALRRKPPLRPWFTVPPALLLLALIAHAAWTQLRPEDAHDPERQALASAYTQRPAEAQRLEFFAPFRSYATVDRLSTQLLADGYAPAPPQGRHAEFPPGAPPNDLVTLRVDSYRHLGVSGRLELQFYNDRLYQLEFQPDDATAYRRAFSARWPQLRRGKNGRSEFVGGGLRIASSLDLATSEVGQKLQTRPYALWQDLRLIDQRDQWDARFGSHPAS